MRIQWRGSLDTDDDEEVPVDHEDDDAPPNGGADLQSTEFGQEVESKRDSEILKEETDDRIAMNRECITVHNLVPRTSMFIPAEENMPLPLDYVDVMRTTRTNIDGVEAEIEDVWHDNANAGRDLTEPWVGTTTFYLVKTRPKKGYAWQYGNCNGLRGTTPRPDFIHPDVWPGLPKTEKKHLQNKWKTLKPIVHAAKNKRGTFHISSDDLNTCNQKVNGALRMCDKDALWQAVPAMQIAANPGSTCSLAGAQTSNETTPPLT